MKKIILFSAAVFVLSSCVKTKTCTCKDSSGNVVYQETRKSTKKKDIEKFEEDCKATQWSTGSSSAPCTVS